jgi:hypothetical protein
MAAPSQEARITMAIEAIHSSKKISRRAAAKIYNVPESTLRTRMDGAAALTNRRPGIQLSTDLEEMVIVQYILDLDS